MKTSGAARCESCSSFRGTRVCVCVWGGPESPSWPVFEPSYCLFSFLQLPLSLSLSPKRFNEAWMLNPRAAYCPPKHTHTHTHAAASIHLRGAKRRGGEPAPSERKHSSDSSSLWLLVWHHCFIFLPASPGICQLFDRTITLCFSSQTICPTSRVGQKVIRESSGSFTAAQFSVS